MVAEHSYCKIGKSPEFESLLCSSEAAGFTAHSKNTQNKIFWRSCVSRYNLRSQKKDFYRKRRQSSSLLFPCRATYFAPERLEEWDEFILLFISSLYNSSFSSYHPSSKQLQRGKELNTFCPPNSRDDLRLLFCLNPSSMFETVQSKILTTHSSLNRGHWDLFLFCSARLGSSAQTQ